MVRKLLLYLLDYKGRVNRTEFFFFFTFSVIVSLLCFASILYLGKIVPALEMLNIFVSLLGVLSLSISYLLVTKRLHDINVHVPFLWQLSLWILLHHFSSPLILKIFALCFFASIIFLYFIPGTKGPNKYGEESSLLSLKI